MYLDFLFAQQRIEGAILEGPPPGGFDCAREAQNRFLYERAWPEQEELLTTTYLYRLEGHVAAFATVCMTSIVLGTREKPASIRYTHVAALHLAQVAVDRRFQRTGLGSHVVGDIIGLGWEVSEDVGCRYLALDAEPGLVGWYQRQGFTINRTMQKQRMEAFADQERQQELPVSMRFDLLNL